MPFKHRFTSNEREKLEIVAALLQQANYTVSRIQQQDDSFTCTVKTIETRSVDTERQRIETLVSHFEIEKWSMSGE